jgi:hypothetical protein
MFALVSCGGNAEFSHIAQALPSPYGNYEAVIESFDNNGVRSYKVLIVDINDRASEYELDIIFRARDRNLLAWADDEEVLWAYSGDVGTFFWVWEEASWVKKSYAQNPNATKPQALR